MKVRTECEILQFSYVYIHQAVHSALQDDIKPLFLKKDTAAQNKPITCLFCHVVSGELHIDARVFARLLLLSLDFLRVELSNICQF